MCGNGAVLVKRCGLPMNEDPFDPTSQPRAKPDKRCAGESKESRASSVIGPSSVARRELLPLNPDSSGLFSLR